MSWRNILPGNGVNKTLDPSVVGPGLTRASNVRLKPGDPVQVHRNRKRSSIVSNLESTTTLIDMHFTAFESNPDWILATFNKGGSTRLSVHDLITGATGTGASTIVDVDGNDTGNAVNSEAVHRGDQYFVGTDKGNVVLDGNATGIDVRHQGMFTKVPADREISINILSNSITPGGQPSADTNWSANDVVLYWWTEYDSVNDIESSPFRFFIRIVEFTASTIYIPVPWQKWISVMQSETVLNSNADKARLYRSFVGNEGSTGTAVKKINKIREELLVDRWPIEGGLLAEIDWAAAAGNPANPATPLVFEDGDADNGASLANVVDGTSDPGVFPPAVSYPTVIVEGTGDIAIFDGLKEPRSWNIGTMFNDSLVVNDPSSSKQTIRWSPPGAPEYQPDPYFMFFASTRSDEIVGLHTANGVLIVLTNGGVFRVNYLPFDRQIAQESGRVQERITDQHGCVGPEASTTVESEQGEFVAWLSRTGLKITNGSGWRDACPDWSVESSGFNASDIATAVLRNNAREYRLELYLSSEDKSERWDFYYHATHRSSTGEYKCTGPHTLGREVKGAALCRVAGEDRIYTADEIDIIGEGTTPDSLKITVETGEIHSKHLFDAASPLSDIRQDGVGLVHTAVSEGGATFTTTTRDTIPPRVLPIDDLTKDSTDVEFGQTVGQWIRFKVEIDPNSGEDISVGPLLIDVEEVRKAIAK